MQELHPQSQEKELPLPNEKLLRSPTLWEKYGNATKWLAISFVLILILLSASTLLLQSQKSATVQLTQAPISTDSTITPISFLIANWKTYRSDKYGFEFQYPKDFAFFPYGSASNMGYSTSISFRNNTGKNFHMEIFPFVEKDLSEKGWLDDSFYLYGPCGLKWFKQSAVKMKNINGMNILQVDGKCSQTVNKPPGYLRSYYVKSQDNNLMVFSTEEFADVNDFNRNSILLEQILSTFNFSKAADLKTYKNENFGFEFQYPYGWYLAEGNSNGLIFIKNADEEGDNWFDIIVENGIIDRDIKTYLARSNLTQFTRTIMIAGQEVVIYTHPRGMQSPGGNVYYFLKDGALYRISSTYNTKSDGVVEKILSTFKFIEKDESPIPTQSQQPLITPISNK